MGIRFRKSIKLGGGTKLNLSKSGVGISAGVKGFRVSKNTSGRSRVTASLPGTGLSYTKEYGSSGSFGNKRSALAPRRSHKATDAPAPEPANEITPKPTETVERVKYTFKVAGISFRTDAIEDMLKEDGDYYESKSYLRENYDDGDRIWQYLSEYRDDVALVDEPENKYDPNAIRVEVGGVHIGYVKKGSTSRVRNLLKKDDVRVKIDIGGGPYKELYEDEDGKIQIERGEIEFYAKLEITAPGEPKPVVETQLPVEVQPAVETKPSAETPVAPTPATRFCRYCGDKIAASAKFCTSCGRPATAPQAYQQPVQQPNVIINNVNAVAVPHGREKNKWVAFFLCLFLGFFGVHRFYEGKIGTGILYLFTLGLVGFGWLIDCIILLTKPNPYYV